MPIDTIIFFKYTRNVMNLKMLGLLLHDKREALGIPLATLARKASVGRSTLWTLERGENPKTGKPSRPAKDILERVAVALRFTPTETDELFTLAGYQIEQSTPQEPSTYLVATTSTELDDYKLTVETLIISLEALRQSSEEIRVEINDLQHVMRDLIQQQDYQRKTHPIEALIAYHYPIYYPFIIQDCLWNIRGENEAHVYMIGKPMTGRNLLEVFFALDVRPMVDDWEQTTRRALWYFYISTKGLFDTLQQNNLGAYEHVYSAYEQLLKQLEVWPDFSQMYKPTEIAKEELQFPDSEGAPFFACELTLMCHLSPLVRLRFQTLVQVVYENGEATIHEALVPQNEETKAALILMHLAASSLPKPAINDTLLKQAIWVLAVLKTVDSGLVLGDLDKQWQPEVALRRNFVAFSARYDKPDKKNEGMLAKQIHFTLDELENRNMVRKSAMIDMIIHLDQRNFFIKRLLIPPQHLSPTPL